MTTAEYGLSKAARSFNSRLDRSKLVEAGFTPLPTWQDKTWKKFKRETPEDDIEERGYSIVETAKQLERYYLEH